MSWYDLLVIGRQAPIFSKSSFSTANESVHQEKTSFGFGTLGIAAAGLFKQGVDSQLSCVLACVTAEITGVNSGCDAG